MRIPQTLTMTAAGLMTPIAMMFLQDTIRTMIPWLLVMLSVVICDLVAGIRKSLKLGVHVSWSLAIRETMGKMVVYVAFVLMVAMIDAASGHSFSIAEYGCLLVCAIEGGSIISNMLKPYGIDISLKSIIKFFTMKATRSTEEEAGALVNEERVSEITEREKDRWEKRHKHKYGSNIEKEKNL